MNNKTRLLIGSTGLALVLALGSGSAAAQFKHMAGGPSDEWTVIVGAGIGIAPEYVGSKDMHASALPLIDMTYRSERYGSFQAGVLSGLRWAPIDTPFVTAGFAVSYDGGRSDKKRGGAFSPGSDHLRGLGEIKGTAVYGAFASAVVAGVQVGAQAFKAPSGHGSGGAYGSVEVGFPYALDESISLTVKPSLTWADSRHMQAYFGVTAEQSRNSGLRTHTAGAGLKSYGLGLEVQAQLNKQWAVMTGASIERLAGDAANSPVVQRRDQPQAYLAATFTF